MPARIVLRAVLVVAVALFALRCGSGTDEIAATSDAYSPLVETAEFQAACADLPTCAEPYFEAPGPAETIWRVLIVREAGGGIRIGRIDSVKVPEGDGVPLGSRAGPYILAGLDGAGEILDAQLIRFPEALRVEYEDGAFPSERIDLAGKEVDTIGYVRALPGIETLSVQDKSGVVAASASVDTAIASTRSETAPSLPGFASAAWASRRPWNGLPPYCSHIVVLQGEDDRFLAEGVTFEDIVTLVYPGPRQLATVQAALGKMTPLLCKSIGRIAFGHVPVKEGEDPVAGAVSSLGTGDMMLINLAAGYSEEKLAERVSTGLLMQNTVIHEAGHCAETLLTTEGSRANEYGGAWGFPPRTLANKTIDHVRLEKGLGDEWQRLHRSFVKQGWAEEHQQEAKKWDGVKVSAAGFMSKYGGTSWWDDIAEYVSLTYMSKPWVDEGMPDEFRLDRACQQMQAHGEKNVPSGLSASYTKLLFLRDLGLVRPEDVDYCTGSSLGLPLDTEGFQFWQETMKLRSFQNNVKANIGVMPAGTQVFQMSAEGEANFSDKSYPARLTLRLDLEAGGDPLAEVSWPRGVYELGLFGQNNVELRLDGAPAGNFNAKDGFVIVAEASNERIAGSIFMTVAFRPHAPLPVPQTFDPPLIIRFLIEK